MPRSIPPRRRLHRLVTAGFAILATATLPAIFLPDSASADDVFNCHGTPFSEATYLSRYADVRAAVEAGSFASGCAHFAAHGHAEGRSGTPDGWQPPGGNPTSNPSETPSENPDPGPTQTNPGDQPSETPSQQPSTQPYSPVFNCYGTPFSESVYLDRYPDVRQAIADGTYPTGCAHFAAVGHTMGYSGTPDGWRPPVEQPGPNEGKPRAAISLGDSFISGEGAGDYQSVRNRQGDDSGFPGWETSNGNAYFCHRSANASLFRASLDHIDKRFSLACSGGQPTDIRHESSARSKGRNVESQLDQMTRVAQNYDIDLVLIGLGSNNSSFTFGGKATQCVGGFLSDAFFGDTRFLLEALNFVLFGDPLPREGACADGVFPDSGQVSSAEAETYAALHDIVETLRRIDSDGQHRIVLQDYTNPLPPDLDQKYHSEPSSGRFDLGSGNRDDESAKFRGLASERYEGGCPIHRRSLPAAHGFSRALGSMVQRNADHLRADFPDESVVYLNVQNAFNGARLCENGNSPNGALATPVRLASHADGTYRDTLNWLNKNHLGEMGKVCDAYAQVCQEAWHPNAAGHGVLGQCLAFAARTNDRSVTCSRNHWTGEITDGPVTPPPPPPYEPPPCQPTESGPYEQVPVEQC